MQQRRRIIGSHKQLAAIARGAQRAIGPGQLYFHGVARLEFGTQQGCEEQGRHRNKSPALKNGNARVRGSIQWKRLKKPVGKKNPKTGKKDIWQDYPDDALVYRVLHD
jgi:hypothetical protein